MPVSQIDPARAHELMRADHIYVDVRTEEEFRAGHPEGAVNVPVFVPTPWGQLAPNADFLPVMAARFAPDAPLVVGCMMGGRSQKACEMLAQAGYSRLANVQGGFGGARDPLGRVMAPGWKDLGLPVSQANGEGVSYASLRVRADAESAGESATG
jgi:rhodanese-related sulfurtransferase